MNRANDIIEELISMGSGLGSLSRAMPYNVPGGYFENFVNSTHGVIKEISEPEAVPAWGKTLPYSLPNGYFENLTGDIISNISAARTTDYFPKEVPFGVPVGYFESLPVQMLKAAKATEGPVKKDTKVIPLRRTYSITSVRWAAAAILLICISLGGYIFFQDQSSGPERMLASIPNNEINEYLQHTYRIDVDRVVNNDDVSNLQLDNKEIIQYLNETGWDVAE